MMHIERASISTAVILPPNKGLVMTPSSGPQQEHLSNSRRETSTTVTNASTSATSSDATPQHHHQQQSTMLVLEETDRSDFSSSLDETEWRDLSSKMSSDTVFPLLASISSASSTHKWPTEKAADHLLPHRSSNSSTTSEEEKQVEESPVRVGDNEYQHHVVVDLSAHHHQNHERQHGAIHEKAWTFDNAPSSLILPVGGDAENKEDLADHDDDSSAALSMYLDSKLAAILLEEEVEQDLAPKEQSPKNRRPGAKQPQHVPTFMETASAATPPTPTTFVANKNSHENCEDDQDLSQPEQNRPKRPQQYHASLETTTSTTENSIFATKEGRERHKKFTSRTEASVISMPPPKPLDSQSRRQSAPSILHHKRRQNTDQLSTSDHPPSAPPLDAVYNPVTGYSPGRSARKRIWGASNAHLPPRRQSSTQAPERLLQRHYSDSSSDADASSVGSEEMLERWSARIRGELRYAELVELAEEAERAADAGEESYTGRPWLCIDGEAGEVILSPSQFSQPSIIKRHASYSEGLPMPTSPLKATPKLPAGVHNLRDAEDVFPSFESFHKNLRTHFLRNRVVEDVLVFDEEEDAEALDGDSSQQSLSLIEQMGDSVRSQMDSFSFDILRRRGWSKDKQDLIRNREVDFGIVGINSSGSTDDEGSDVGEVLAEHIHSVDDPVRESHPISLPGLPLLETVYSLPCASRRGASADKALCGQSTIGRSPSVDDEGLARPRILFPSGQNVPRQYTPIMSSKIREAIPHSPLTPMHQQGESHDFVTPARLREIRHPKGDMQNFPNDQSMILPANSVIQESPIRKTPIGVASSDYQQAAAGSARVPVRHLLLPAFSSGMDEEAEPMVQLAPSRSFDSLDDDDDDVPPNPLSTQDIALFHQMGHDRPMTQTKPQTDGSLKTHSPMGSLVLGSSDDEATAVTEVKVSIVDKSLDPSGADASSPNRRIVRPSIARADKSVTSGQKVFTMKHLVNKTSSQASFDAIDCRCLSPSMGHMHDLLESGADAIDSHRKSNKKDRFPLHGAMNMLKKFSPHRERKIAKSRDLFVHPRDNDDFLQNYLYCTKDTQEQELDQQHRDACMNGEPCQDDGFCGSGFSLVYNYCGLNAQEADCATAYLGASRHRSTLDILPLTLDRHKHHKTQADSWFEAATERVDGMLETLIRGSSHKDDRFQPPSLRKIVRPETRQKPGTIRDALEEEEGNVPDTPVSMERHPSVQALFKPTEDDLSDTQFALVYGTSRSDYRSSTAATTSPLRPELINQEDPTSHPPIPTSYSSSSDEEEQRLDITMTYISEPSL